MSKQVKYSDGFVGTVSDPVAAILAARGEATICRPRPFGGPIENSPAVVESIRQKMQKDAEGVTGDGEAANV